MAKKDIVEIRSYKTSDNKLFSTRDEAERHEVELETQKKRQWYVGKTISHFYQSNENHNEGLYIIEFTDSSRLTFGATGDDMTYVWCEGFRSDGAPVKQDL